MGRRTLLFVAAVVVAAVGTTLVYLYVNGVDKRAAAGLQTVKVLVAKSQIQVGTTARDAEKVGGFVEKDFLTSSIEGTGIVNDLSEIIDEVAIAPIPAGTPITRSMFGSAGSEQLVPLAKGESAVTVQLSDPARVGTFVQPGADVAVFLTLAPGGGRECTQVLFPRVTVVAAGESTLISENDPQATATPSSGSAALMTLGLTQAQAEKLVFAQGHGELYFALLNKLSDIKKTGTCVDAGNVFN